MTLEEQWQEDVKLFGNLAYLMWHGLVYQCSYSDNMMPITHELFSNSDLEEYYENAEIERKQSAALPFDLVAARGGDEFYFTHDDGFKELIPINELHLFVNRFHLLKMKHPRRVGVDYSQFED